MKLRIYIVSLLQILVSSQTFYDDTNSNVNYFRVGLKVHNAKRHRLIHQNEIQQGQKEHTKFCNQLLLRNMHNDLLPF